MSGPFRCPLLRTILLFVFATGLWLPATAEPVAVDSVTAVSRELHRIEFLIPEQHSAQLNAIPRTQITGPGTSLNWREKVPFSHSVYLRLALSAVLQVNEALVVKRARVQSLVVAHANPKDLAWLSRIIADYEVATAYTPPSEALKTELLLRLDILPPSLVIAKGALDSGWLPSRYANLEGSEFGRWTLGRMTAAETDSSGFRQPRAALEAYMHYLNTDPSFSPKRVARAAQRAEGKPLDGQTLVVYLAPALGRLATQKLQRIIQRSKLKYADQARLSAEPVFVFKRIEKQR